MTSTSAESRIAVSPVKWLCLDPYRLDSAARRVASDHVETVIGVRSVGVARRHATACDSGLRGGASVTAQAGSCAGRDGDAILLIEDDRHTSALVSTVLEMAGYRVLPATDGNAALDVSRREGARIRLVLTDFALPGMQGMEVYRALGQEGVTAPVIVLSGYSRPMTMEGIAAWLQKPLEIEELLTTVKGAFAPARR
jgi:CheY-like chemotaxis protein